VKNIKNPVQDAFVRELAVVVGALIASDTTVGEATSQQGGQWTATLNFSGPVSGTCTIALDEGGIVAVTRALLGGDGETPEDAMAGTVRELLTQAAAAVGNESELRGLAVEVGSVSFYESLQFPPAAFTRAITSPLLAAPVIVAIDGSLAEPDEAVEPIVEVPHHHHHDEDVTAMAGVGDRIGVILDIDLPVVVRFGRTDLPLRQLTRLGPGSVIDLGRSADDPVELLVSDRVIARGEVVIVSGNYGVRILDVVSPTDRMRSMEA
jgi:flagellar motor switch protein FliN/FliY